MQLEILRWIQRLSHPLLDLLMEGFTVLGEATFLAAVLCGVYWCVDKEWGKRLAVALFLSLCVNGVVKDLVKAPRPIGEAGIVSRQLRTATGHSFPSGHTQGASVFWVTLSLLVDKRWAKIGAGAILLLVGFSRMYLGVHYPADVLAAWALGIGVALFAHWMSRRPGGYAATLWIALLAALAALLVAESGDTFKAVGMQLGLYAGFWLEHRFVGFQPRTAGMTKRLLRLALGGFLLCLVLVLLAALPKNHLVDLAGYGLLVFVALGLYPLLFTKLHL